ncbi:MAG: hypothetical protein COB46_02120 [Rhodospirillaceae bacterium]|nr:MAG: hypothetical protein COB46_02120 [Rhodospirillaceae bacterium]
MLLFSYDIFINKITRAISPTVPLIAIMLSATGCVTTSADGSVEGMTFRTNAPVGAKGYGIQWGGIEQGYPVRRGTQSQRFEVQPGDCGRSDRSSWSDCENDRERSERRQIGYQTEGQTRWYGWSIYFPKDYPNIHPTKVALGQFSEEDSYRTTFMFQNSFGGYNLEAQTMNDDFQNIPLITKEALRGKWHDIVVEYKLSNRINGDGYFRVWVNGELKAEVKGRTTHRNKVYFIYGIYRTKVSKGLGTAQVVYYDEIRHGNSREDVDIRIIEQQLK